MNHARDFPRARRQPSIPTISLDLELCAGVVELRSTGFALRAVKGDVLDADEVLAIRQTIRDLEGYARLAPGAPGILQSAIIAGIGAEEGLADFEPVAAAVVGFDVVGGGFGEVDLGRT